MIALAALSFKKKKKSQKLSMSIVAGANIIARQKENHYWVNLYLRKNLDFTSSVILLKVKVLSANKTAFDTLCKVKRIQSGFKVIINKNF